jgi:hypothetical protein
MIPLYVPTSTYVVPIDMYRTGPVRSYYGNTWELLAVIIYMSAIHYRYSETLKVLWYVTSMSNQTSAILQITVHSVKTFGTSLQLYPHTIASQLLYIYTHPPPTQAFQFAQRTTSVIV